MRRKDILNQIHASSEADIYERYSDHAHEQEVMRSVAYIVDDDQDDRLHAGIMLEKSGKVQEIRPMRCADDLFECLENNGLYDDMDYSDEHMPIIFLDLHMPEMNGIEVLERIRNHPITSDFPVILLTSDQSGQKIQDAYQLHANGYLKKPLVLAELNEVLAEIDKAEAKINFGSSSKLSN